VTVTAANSVIRGDSSSAKIANVRWRAFRVLIASIRAADRQSIAMTASLALKPHPYHPGVLVR
jgi:hypothetical protein